LLLHRDSRPGFFILQGGAVHIDSDNQIGIVIVGAGFAGLGAGARLKRSGIDDFVILERADQVGGTWRDNTYPGCACDIPSALYSYSFAPSTSWSRIYPRQPEIFDYLKDCVGRFSLEKHVRFGADMQTAHFDEAVRLWRLRCADGRSVTARMLILAMGGLNKPHIPQLPGRELFQGFAFHSAQWNHNIDMSGKRIGVIGTGASAIQIVPELAHTAGEVVVFQRTPAWIVERGDKALTPRTKHALSLLAARLKRWGVYWRQEVLALGFTVAPKLMRHAEQGARRVLYKRVRAPDVRAALDPQYAMGCKRILVSDDFYNSLNQSHVRLERHAAAEFEPAGVVTTDGRHVALDGVVFATGFKAADMLGSIDVRGRGQRSLKDRWLERAGAYLGLSVHGFPNLFLMVGPNTGLGHNSVVFMIEAQASYILSAAKILLGNPGSTLEVKEEVERRFATRIAERFKKTIWATGCNSWYLDERGNNFALWPGTTVEYWWRTRHLRASDYIFQAARSDLAAGHSAAGVSGRQPLEQ
jgi:cation diffusion facilitator CzcD-associated flavoprotein CzcO